MSRDTLHLLLLTHDQNEAENIISLLRNSGKATRAHFVESIEDFTQQLQEKLWDLVITYPQVGDIKLQDLVAQRSEEHTSELQSRPHLVCRLLLEKKNKN